MEANNEILTPNSSRRSVLKGTVAGVTSMAALAAFIGVDAAIGSNQNTAYAASENLDSTDANVDADSIQTILNIAVTAETLAVVFYANALKNANRLGIGPVGKMDIQAALIEEFIHKLFLERNGGKALVTKFSFPFGANTFQQFNKFLKVQQQLEALFVAAYLAAGRRFANLKRPDLVLIAAQIGGVEAEHRAVGRALGGLNPANNRAFESALLAKVSDAANVLKRDGFLNPVKGNMFSFQDVANFVQNLALNQLIMRNPTDMDWSN